MFADKVCFTLSLIGFAPLGKPTCVKFAKLFQNASPQGQSLLFRHALFLWDKNKCREAKQLSFANFAWKAREANPMSFRPKRRLSSLLQLRSRGNSREVCLLRFARSFASQASNALHKACFTLFCNARLEWKAKRSKLRAKRSKLCEFPPKRSGRESYERPLVRRGGNSREVCSAELRAKLRKQATREV